MMCLIKWFPRFPATIIFAVAVAFCVTESAKSSSFQNLNFESAVIEQPPAHLIPTSQAMPGWATNNYYSGYVIYDDLSLGSTAVSIQDGLSPWGGVLMQPIQGSYSVMLQSGFLDPFGPPVAAWITQTGDVSGLANSLMYSTESNYSNLVVSLNGTEIPMTLYSVGTVINANHGNVETFIGDIRAFSGQQDVELKFEVSHPGYADVFATLDAIHYSTIIIPEPSSLVLLASAALATSAYIFRRHVA